MSIRDRNFPMERSGLYSFVIRFLLYLCCITLKPKGAIVDGPEASYPSDRR